jgi:hypothetical protein
LLVLIPVGASAWSFVRSQRSEPSETAAIPIITDPVAPDADTVPSGKPNAVPAPIGPGPDSAADVQVKWSIKYYRVDGSNSDLTYIGTLDNGSIRPRKSDRVVIEAEFDRPVYAYLVALNPDGSQQTLFPETDSITPSTLKKFVCPDASTKYLTLDQPGLQGFILFAADEALPPSISLPQPNSQEWQSAKPEYAWSYDGTRLQPLHNERVGVAEHGPRPLGDVCDAIKMLPGVSAVRAVAIPVAQDAAGS